MKHDTNKRPLQDPMLCKIALEKTTTGTSLDRGLLSTVAIGPHERAQSQYPTTNPLSEEATPYDER